VTVCGVDHQHVDAVADQFLRPARGIAVDPDRDADHEPAVGVDRRLVDRRAQGTLAGDHPEQAPVVDDGCNAQPVATEVIERRSRLDVGAEDVQARAHHVLELCEPVEPLAVTLGEHADGDAVVDDDDGPVRPLVDQRQCIGDGGVGAQRDRRLEDGVASLDVVDHAGDDVDRDVLREDRDAATSGHGLGHATAGDRGHVRHDERDGGPDPVRSPQVDAHPRRDVGQARHHEDVVVGQVEARIGVKHAHGVPPRVDRPLGSPTRLV
jgi:hypothetical protein